eukprot:3521337-Pleurochrysis_carterae.AAC.5
MCGPAAGLRMFFAAVPAAQDYSWKCLSFHLLSPPTPVVVLSAPFSLPLRSLPSPPARLETWSPHFAPLGRIPPFHHSHSTRTHTPAHAYTSHSQILAPPFCTRSHFPAFSASKTLAFITLSHAECSRALTLAVAAPRRPRRRLL